MKSYRVFIDITIATQVCVEAESEQEAKKLAMEKYNKDPYYYANNAGSLVDAGVVDIDEIMED